MTTALIIGGGIAGPVTAMALRRAGIDATVHEAYDSASDGVGAALTLAPNGLAALKIIGADEDVQEKGLPIRGMVTSTATGFQLAEVGGLEGLPPSRLISRADLFAALRDRALAAGVPIVYGKRLVSAEETADGVTAHFADGTTATGDLLVGADGINSTVRGLIDPQAPGLERIPLIGIGATADVKTDTKPETMHFAFGKAFIGYWSLPDGRTGWFTNLPHAEALSYQRARAIPGEEWLDTLRETVGDEVPGRELVAHTSPENLVAIGAMEVLPSVPRWFSGRMVLVGDSAHAPSSSSGQGASLAVESAIQLARCLRDLPDLGEAFAAYEELRRSRVEMVAARAAALNDKKSGKGEDTDLETQLGPEQRYTIDWDAPVTRGSSANAAT
ncbi:FAD-dependent oxidoreductase [Nonomuraea sp. NPDC050556]|uniref:FAD-dependent oxidoreductase n=1 Tax=Nonomuraea sp. NPDC050556 TaxID=3364369 RepID=UPI0037ABE1C6